MSVNRTLGRRQFASWFEPEHYIVDNIADFFARRFADMDWVIDTPKGSVSFVNHTISFHPLSTGLQNVVTTWMTFGAPIMPASSIRLA